ncbi:uncharacterized protein DUF2442 [Paenibacillus cellulosilyticus]|uniref:Uncharacterized protein DUF2442 n=1 Tax=Paenibacillus cellulosilyticus TaxID=375489 RepID=A0A2V2YNL0_9BACL|nr:DUF2442 domain-containing protein [Paenibacillus cellulosilyticus]PWV97400.1 uncharacterized protein DUF2442 [Paenibacillus cellulosilyticus]QKS48559.1 DUF2442 domain-containing protein [Paenibacillus cellulosilyticus]
MNRIIGVYPTRAYKLILEYPDGKYRIYDAKKQLSDKASPLGDIIGDYELFRSAHVVEDTGTVGWSNGVDLDPDVLYDNSELDAQLS